MDIITYAKKNKISTKYIPSSNVVVSYAIYQALKASREKVFDDITADEIPFESVSSYCDADSSRITYLSPFYEESIIEFVDSQQNLVDKILCLNPKQIGNVNPNIDVLFDYGNQLHYLTCKYSIVSVFEDNNDELDARYPMKNNRIKYFNSDNRRYLGYGSLNINNILFSSLLFRFASTGFEIENLSFNPNLSTIYDVENVRSIPYKTDYSKTIPSSVSGSYLELSGSNGDYVVVNTQQVNGITLVESPFNFAVDKTTFNENIIVDRTHPLWDSSFKITLQKDIHYSNNGSDITYLNPSTNLSNLDDLLKSIYSWKSCLIILEKENKLWNSTNKTSPRYIYEFLLLVGIKTKDYKLTEKIDSMFYITAGDNYINSDKFSKKDIFFIKSSLKKMLNLYKPDKAHFFDLSSSDYGNICKNGLLFGMQSDLQDYIIDMINKKDNQFIKTTSKIENLYELFEQL
jgi:hypothetical protein